jgi:antiviral helicase SLH1
MATKLDTMESEWLTKLAAMRESIAKLNLSEHDSSSPIYGSDLGLNDDEFLYGSGSDDIWDLISDDADDSPDENVVSTANGALAVPSQAAAEKFDRNWLRNQCAMVASRKSGLEVDALKDQIIAILASDNSGK